MLLSRLFPSYWPETATLKERKRRQTYQSIPDFAMSFNRGCGGGRRRQAGFSAHFHFGDQAAKLYCCAFRYQPAVSAGKRNSCRERPKRQLHFCKDPGTAGILNMDRSSHKIAPAPISPMARSRIFCVGRPPIVGPKISSRLPFRIMEASCDFAALALINCETRMLC